MTGGQWGGKQGMWGPTGTGRSNAYFVASLNGGAPAPGAEFYLGWYGPPLAPDVEPPLVVCYAYSKKRQEISVGI